MPLTINTSTNPSFPYDLATAREAFFQVFNRLQREPLSTGQAKQAYEQKLRDLQQQGQHILALARAGLLDQVTAGADAYLKDYARLLALHRYYQGPADALTLGLSPSQTGRYVTEQVQRRHRELTDQVLHAITEAAREREARERREGEALARERREGEALARTRAALLEESMEREHARNQDLYRLLSETQTRLGEQVGRVPQEVRAAYDDARKSLASAQESLNIAMRGAELMQTSTREDVIEKVETGRVKRKIRRGCSTLAVGCAAIFVFGLAYLLLQVLVH